MALFLENKDIAEVLQMSDCLAALEEAYIELGRGTGVNRLRADLYSPNALPDCHHIFKTMEGTLPAGEVVALRIGSNVVLWREVRGTIRKEGVRNDPQGRFLGLVLLFSTKTGDLLSIMQDSFLQKMRVGAANGLAAKYLARSGTSSVGLIGSGWQAGAQLEAFTTVYPVKEVKVYSTKEENRNKFAAEMRKKLGIEVIPVSQPHQVVPGAGILASATNSIQPVINREWLAPGMFVSCVKQTELSPAARAECDFTAVNSREGNPENYLPGYGKVMTHDPVELLSGMKVEGKEEGAARWDEYPELCELAAGKVPGRKSEEDITCFINNIGLGIQFAAVGALAYRLAREKGLGRKLEEDFFLQHKEL